MARVLCKRERHPLIVFEWPAEFARADLDAFLADMRTAVREEKPIAILNDIRRTRAPSAAERKLITDAVDANASYFSKYVVAWSDVSESTLIRGVITAIRWVAPSVYPHKVHATIELGEAWCLERLAAAGARPSPRTT